MKLRLLLTAFCALSPAAFAAPSATDLLRASAGADDNLSYTATMNITRKGTAPMTIKMWRDGAKKRFEWTAPPLMAGDMLVDDGNSVWRYHRADNSAVQTRGTAFIDWKRLGNSMQAELSGTGTVANRTAWIIALSPKGGAPAMKVWVDQKNLARLRVERLENGKTAQTMVMQSVSFGDVPAASFRWAPPAGARITRTSGTLYSDSTQAKRAANWLLLPAAAPSGYVFESAVVDPTGANGLGEAWLRYANGMNRFSIFQQRTNDTQTVAAQRVDGGWFVQRGGNRLLILGLPDNQARRVLDSLK